MSLRIVQLGTARAKNEGLRIGTVRRPPRGVRKEDYARLNYYDVWLPELAPSAELVAEAMSTSFSDQSWRKFARRYLTEMKSAPAQRLLDLLAALSHTTNFSVGCYCENDNRCHRSLLRDLLRESGAKMGT